MQLLKNVWLTRYGCMPSCTMQTFVKGQAESEQQAEQYPLQHSALIHSLLTMQAFPGAFPKINIYIF